MNQSANRLLRLSDFFFLFSFFEKKSNFPNYSFVNINVFLFLYSLVTINYIFWGLWTFGDAILVLRKH